jgi:hypothetical protein
MLSHAKFGNHRACKAAGRNGEAYCADWSVRPVTTNEAMIAAARKATIKARRI